MRTREDQIEAIYFMIDDASHSECRRLANEWLDEAERRAEQRVREDIGRDSERLDNMREKLRIAKNGLLRVKEITGESSRAHQAADRALMQIAARPIDASREVG